jgi:hypothetical protein
MTREPTPLFVLGSGRCGSTLLWRMLDAHPSIAMTNEGRIADFLHFCVQIAGLPAYDVQEFPLAFPVRMHGIVAPPYVASFAPMFTRAATDLFVRWYAHEFRSRDFVYFGDKLPDPYAAHAVREVFPSTRCIVLIRDPRDTYGSVRRFAARSDIRERNPLLEVPAPDDYAQRWTNLYSGLAKTFTDAYWLRYEDLVADPGGELRRLLDALGLPFEGLPDLRSGDAGFDKHGTSPTPDASVGRHRVDLDDAERASFDRICGDWLDRYGYRDPR